MDAVKNQLVKDVAELKQFQITEGRVREIVKVELEQLQITVREIVKVELESLQITESRVREIAKAELESLQKQNTAEIVKAELVAAAPPQELVAAALPPERKRLFKSSLKKKSQA